MMVALLRASVIGLGIFNLSRIFDAIASVFFLFFSCYQGVEVDCVFFSIADY
jgi:hypothetical protein